VSVTINLSAHFAARRDAYILSEPLAPFYVGSNWNSADRIARRKSVHFAVVDSTGEFDLSTYKDHVVLLKAFGFHPILRRGPVTVYRRP
jgi:hypothetical protein